MIRLGLAPVLFGALYLIYHLMFVWVGGLPENFSFTASRYYDLALLYAIVPAYFLMISGFVQRRTDYAYRQLTSLLDDPTSIDKKHFVKPIWLIVGGVVGLAYGTADFQLTPDETGGAEILERTLNIGNGLVWTSVGLVIGWRLACARLFIRLGELVRIDLLDLHKVKPLGMVASLDVFVTMGALALMPLQSVSSDFHWAYYQAGFAIGIPSSLALLALPQLGVRKNIRAHKVEQVSRLQAEIDQVERDDVVKLEALLAHKERIQDLSEWPIDTKVMGRAMLYLVVPPLAWVGAAIVERGVEQFF